MSRDLKRQLIICYVALIAIALLIGVMGQSMHKLDVGSVITLCVFVVGFSSIYTIYSVKDERETGKSLLELRADLEPLGFHILKQKGDSYDVIDSDSTTPGHEPIVEGLSLSELEAFRDGLFTGIDMCQVQEQPSIANICTSAGDTDIDTWLAMQEEIETGTDMEARLASQAAQHEEDKNYYSQWGLHEDE